MMMFTLDQATDTHMPEIAAEIAADFRPSLADEPPAPVRLTMRREVGPPSRRIYTLQLRPIDAIARVPSSLATFMYDASNLCAVELEGTPGEIRIRCVADLPGGASKEITWLRDGKAAETGMSLLREIAVTAPVPPEAQKR